MKLTSFISAVLLVLITIGTAAAQIAAPEYQSPITLEQQDVIYTVNADGTYTRDDTTRIRINIDQAVQSQAQTYLQFSETLESLEVLEAYTDTAAGERVNVPKDKIITQQSPVSTNAPAFGDIKITAIVFPQISAGATKTYRCRSTQIKPLFENQFSLIEYFPINIDVKSATVTLIAPEDLKINVQAIGIEGGQVESDVPGKSKWIWTIKDRSGQRPELYAINAINYSPRIAATTFADFNELADAYLERESDKEKVTDEVRKLADKITAGLTNPRDQAAALYHWVAGNNRYVALAFGLGGVVPRDADTIIQTGYGDCKDKVVLLNALLAAKGIKSAPVLINARDVYWQPDVASPFGVYNHAITYLPEFDMFLDPTSETAPFGTLPYPLFSKSALVTRGLDKGSGLKVLPDSSPETSTSDNLTTITISDDGAAKGKSAIRAKGAIDYVLRSVMASIPPGQEGQLARAAMASAGQQGEAALSFNDPRNLAEDFKIETEFTVQNAMLLPGPGALIVPAGVPMPSPIQDLARMVNQPKITFPMLCLGGEKVETTLLTLPDSVKVTQLPRPVNVQNAYGSYSATYEQNGQTIKVERRLVVKMPLGLCTPEVYPQIGEIGQSIGRDLRAQILYGD
jgi:transglutaminase-like putative cysteine protease